MAWNRVVEVLIGTDPTDPATVVDIAGLDISGRVVRTCLASANTAEITIYNAAKTTRNQISAEGRALIVKLGYEDDGAGVVFIGTVDHAVSTHVGPDWVTKVSAVSVRSTTLDGGAGFGTTPVALSFAPGTKLESVLDKLALVLGLDLLGGENARDITLANGFVFPGSATQALLKVDKILKSNSCGLHIDVGAIVVYKAGQAISEFTGIYLDYDTGLLNAEPVEDHLKETRLLAKTKKAQEKARKRLSDASTQKAKTAATQTLLRAKVKEEEIERDKVKIRALINHLARPNAPVTVKSEQVDGTYLADSVVFDFDNQGGKFEMELEASA